MKKFLILIMSGIILSQNVYCASLGKEIASVQQDQKVQNLEEGANKVSVDQVLLNQQLMDIPGGVLEVKGQKLYPLVCKSNGRYCNLGCKGKNSHSRKSFLSGSTSILILYKWSPKWGR